MGKHDSSKTRVQPVLGALLTRDQPDWLPQFLQLGSRAGQCFPGGVPDPGPLRKDGLLKDCFEYAAKSPACYLRALLAAPERLQRAVAANPRLLESSKDPEVKRRRQLLIDGDAETLEEGLKKIDAGRTKSGKGTWWVLEGTTMVDCAILTENTTLFIEGKRTEPKLTNRVSWDPYRSQVFRNLDAARGHRQGTGNFYALLIVQQNSTAEKDAIAMDAGYKVAVPSWPHLTDAEAKELYERHYLGYTTWETIATTFNLTLHDTVDDSTPTHSWA